MVQQFKSIYVLGDDTALAKFYEDYYVVQWIARTAEREIIGAMRNFYIDARDSNSSNMINKDYIDSTSTLSLYHKLTARKVISIDNLLYESEFLENLAENKVIYAVLDMPYAKIYYVTRTGEPYSISNFNLYVFPGVGIDLTKQILTFMQDTFIPRLQDKDLTKTRSDLTDAVANYQM